MLELFKSYDFRLFEGEVQVDFYLCLNDKGNFLRAKERGEKKSSMKKKSLENLI